MKFSQALAGSCLLALLTGCTVTPGMRNDVDDGSTSAAIEIVPITGELVAGARAQQLSADVGGLPEPLQSVMAGGDTYQYRVGPGDILSIIVWDHPELTNPFGQLGDPLASGSLVARDGTMFYPNVGVFEAQGKTLGEIRKFLAERLARVIRDPQVDVKVAAFRSQRVYVTGEVAQPGLLFLDEQPKGVLDAINERGGLAETANRRRATLARGGQTYEIDLGALYARGAHAFNALLQAGDVLHIPDVSREKVILLGELTREQAIPMQRSHMSLAEALSTGGGLQAASANPRALFVFRAPSAESPESLPKVYSMDLTRADSLLLAEQFALQPRDVIYVGSTDFAKYNRVIGQLLPTISAVFQIDRLTSSR